MDGRSWPRKTAVRDFKENLSSAYGRESWFRSVQTWDDWTIATVAT